MILRRIISGGLMVSAFLAVVYAVYDYNRLTSRLTSEKYGFVREKTDVAARDAVKVTASVESLGAALGTALAEQHMTRKELEKLLHDTLLAHAELLRVSVAFEPFAFDPTRRLYGPCARRATEGIVGCRMDDDYDYTAPQFKWYHTALAKGGTWSEPQYSEADGLLEVNFSIPFSLPGAVKKSGVVIVSLRMAVLDDVVQMIDLGNKGHGFMVSPAAKFIVHPVKDYARQQISVFTVAKQEHNQALVKLGHMALEGRGGTLDYVSTLTKKPSWLNCDILPSTRWLICTVYDRNDLARDQIPVSLKLYAVILTSLVFVITASLTWLLWSDSNRRGRAWVCVILVSLGFLAAIGVIWAHTLHTPYWKITPGQFITGKSSVNRFANQQIKKALLSGQSLPQFIPTGIYIQSSEFISPNNVSMQGYVWQRYTKGLNDNLKQGFIMPEAETADIQEFYRFKQGDEEYVGWNFRVTVRQSFDYSNFPFDWQSIWIRMWPKDFDKNVILVPETESYTLLDPASKPGIEEQIVIGGWIPQASFFEYRFNSYNSNFGLVGYVGQKRFPELYFNLILQRDFADPFISNLTPIFLVMLLVFAMLVTISKDSRTRELLGFNAAGIIATSSALFFAALIAHIDIRSKLQTQGIFYLEYFFFITYIMIFAVCVNSILFTFEGRLRLVHFEDNLVPKMLFWPLVTGMMFAVTFWIFY